MRRASLWSSQTTTVFTAMFLSFLTFSSLFFFSRAHDSARPLVRLALGNSDAVVSPISPVIWNVELGRSDHAPRRVTRRTPRRFSGAPATHPWSRTHRFPVGSSRSLSTTMTHQSGRAASQSSRQTRRVNGVVPFS